MGIGILEMLFRAKLKIFSTLYIWIQVGDYERAGLRYPARLFREPGSFLITIIFR